MHAFDVSRSEPTEPHLPDWIDIWVNPRSSGRRIASTRSRTSAVLLLALTTVATISFFTIWLQCITDDAVAWPFIGPLITIGASAQLIGLAVFAGDAGQRRGGDGSSEDLFIAASWTLIPYIFVGLVVFGIVMARFGTGVFWPPVQMEGVLYDQVHPFTVFIPMFFAMAVSTIAYLQVVSELHHLTLWQAYHVSRDCSRRLIIPIVLVAVLLFFIGRS